MSLIERLQSLEFPTGEADTNLISEIALNVLYGTVHLSDTDRAFFKRHKPALRILVSKAPWKRRLNSLTRPLFCLLYTSPSPRDA